MPHPLNYRRPQDPPPRPKRTLVQAIAAQWLGFAGLGLIAFGLWVVYETHQAGGNPASRKGLIFIVWGVVMVLFWAFSGEKNSDYNF
jgi:hypothetical protein